MVKIILVIVVAVFLIGAGLVRLARFDCNRLATNSGVQTKFDWVGDGCYIKVDDKFIPEDRWRAFND